MDGVLHIAPNDKFRFTRERASGNLRAGASYGSDAERFGGRARHLAEGGIDGSGDENPRPDDGSRHEHAHRSAQGRAGAGDSADLGGRLRSERHRSGNRESANSPADDP